MRIVTSCLALILIATAFPALAADPPSATAAICRSIEKNQCGGAGTKFSADVGKLFGFSLITNVPDKITHVWFHNDKEKGRWTVGAPVNAPRWKAFSNITVSRDMVGPWRLEIRDSSNTVLATANFTVQ